MLKYKVGDRVRLVTIQEAQMNDHLNVEKTDEGFSIDWGCCYLLEENEVDKYSGKVGTIYKAYEGSSDGECNGISLPLTDWDRPYSIKMDDGYVIRLINDYVLVGEPV